MNNNSRFRGLDRLLQQREETRNTREQMEELKDRFAQLDRSTTRVVSSFNLFQTPEALADQLADLLCEDGRAPGRTLEPSAGLGRLYKALRRVDSGCWVTLVDVSPDCCAELLTATVGDSNTEVVQADFLSLDADRVGLFDSVIANPPFQRGTDVEHLQHALKLLKPGGRLVSVVANGPKQQRTLKPLASQWIDLPQGSFKQEGTGANTAIVVIDK